MYKQQFPFTMFSFCSIEFHDDLNLPLIVLIVQRRSHD